MTAAFSSAGASGALPAATDPLAATIAALEARLDDMPRLHAAASFAEWDRARDELAQAIRCTSGGRVTSRPDLARVTLHGITASSTAGVVAATRTWIAAARRRINEEDEA